MSDFCRFSSFICQFSNANSQYLRVNFHIICPQNFYYICNQGISFYIDNFMTERERFAKEFLYIDMHIQYENIKKYTQKSNFPNFYHLQKHICISLFIIGWPVKNSKNILSLRYISNTIKKFKSPEVYIILYHINVVFKILQQKLCLVLLILLKFLNSITNRTKTYRILEISQILARLNICLPSQNKNY